jgi:hypothetical protein
MVNQLVPILRRFEATEKCAAATIFEPCLLHFSPVLMHELLLLAIPESQQSFWSPIGIDSSEIQFAIFYAAVGLHLSLLNFFKSLSSKKIELSQSNGCDF